MIYQMISHFLKIMILILFDLERLLDYKKKN